MKSIKVSTFVDRLDALPESRKAFVDACYKWLDMEMVAVILRNHWKLKTIDDLLPMLDDNGYVIGKDKGKYFLTKQPSSLEVDDSPDQ